MSKPTFCFVKLFVSERFERTSEWFSCVRMSNYEYVHRRQIFGSKFSLYACCIARKMSIGSTHAVPNVDSVNIFCSTNSKSMAGNALPISSPDKWHLKSFDFSTRPSIIAIVSSEPDSCPDLTFTCDSVVIKQTNEAEEIKLPLISSCFQHICL